MVTSEYIITVTEVDFEYEVIAYSKNTPVLVDFWAEWCGPCRMLGPILERLANEGEGAFRLAKVNVDDNPNLAIRYNVRSIPIVKAFRDGAVVSELVGAQPEGRVREFIKALSPSKTDLILEKGFGELSLHDFSQAEIAFRQYLASHPQDPTATLGLIRSLVLQKRINEAYRLIKSFPPSKEYIAVEKIRLPIEAAQRLASGAALSDDPLEAAYNNSLRLILIGNIPAAMDGLLDVIRQNKNYRNQEPRQVILGLFEILGDEDPLTRQYRNELALVLF